MSVFRKKYHNKDIINAKILMMLENGRIEVTNKEELEKYPIGSLISYININDEYKEGGFITKFRDDYFIYITTDFTNKYRARYKNVKMMIVGDVYKVKRDVISLTKTTQKTKTKFPIIVGGICIRYAQGNFDSKRYMSTDRYKILTQWYDYFHRQ